MEPKTLRKIAFHLSLGVAFLNHRKGTATRTASPAISDTSSDQHIMLLFS